MEQDNPEVLFRVAAAMGAQLTVEQTEAAAASLREQAASVADDGLRQQLMEAAESLTKLASSLPQRPDRVSD
jgi:hypothetical protein